MQILKAYDRARFGRRSEKLGASEPSADDEAQQAIVFEEIETGIAAPRAQVGKGRSSEEKRPPRPRKGFPPNLERVEVVTAPEDLPEHAGTHSDVTVRARSWRPIAFGYHVYLDEN